jgi:hypothetical protein
VGAGADGGHWGKEGVALTTGPHMAVRERGNGLSTHGLQPHAGKGKVGDGSS